MKNRNTKFAQKMTENLKKNHTKNTIKIFSVAPQNLLFANTRSQKACKMTQKIWTQNFNSKK